MEEKGGEYGEVDESFLDACDEGEEEEWGEVEWTRHWQLMRMWPRWWHSKQVSA